VSDLNARLDQTFAAIDPGPAPVEAAMEHGKKIRNRRRAAALAGSVAVIAGAVACVPALAHHQALPSPANSRVTVNPPGPHSPAGMIASGLIGDRHWDLRLESPNTKNCMITGIGLGITECGGYQPQAEDPIAFGGMGGSDNADGSGKETFFVSYGVVRADVVSARVVLANGTVLTLRPVKVHGTRWVAFADPAGAPVDSLTVYSRTGEIATSIPFNGPSGASGPTFATWLRPGQAAGAARFTKVIGSGTADGHAWAVTAYIGPWGTCIEGGGGDCFASTTPAQAGTGVMGSGGNQPSGALVWGEAADSVSYLIVTPKGGTAMRVGVTAVGQQKYFAFGLSREPRKGDRWTAYDAAGKSVASGPVPGPVS
jgi:hypothetical protein